MHLWLMGEGVHLPWVCLHLSICNTCCGVVELCTLGGQLAGRVWSMCPGHWIILFWCSRALYTLGQ